MSEKVILVWFRNDLRVDDNEILAEAVRKADKVLPVYIFDPFYFKTDGQGALKTGSFRTRFLLESVADLRNNLRGLGAELLICTGGPAEVLPALAIQYNISEVYHHREVAPDETGISEKVEAALWKIKLNLKHFIGHTMYHKEDLPFPIKDIPDSFVSFKKKVERDSIVRPCTLRPGNIAMPHIDDAGDLPSMADLGVPEPIDDSRAVNQFKGGETTALVQLHTYLSNSMQNNNKGGNTATSVLSPWLALGCISPRRVYWEVINYQRDHHLQNNDPLVLELLWRDYFRFMFKKHGQKFFYTGDAVDEGAENPKGDGLFEDWKNGETGVAYIDAAMHELNATGYISNYARQAVALYLINELKLDWMKGAVYFEEKLIDHSPASNWGNWAFVAGIGNDAKSSRLFNAAKPTVMDAKNDITNTWLTTAAD